GNSGALFCKFEGVRLERLFVFVESVNPFIDEILAVPALVEDAFGDSVKPDLVRRWIGANEKIGALCHLMPAQVDDDMALAAEFVGSFKAGGDDRMVLRCVGADDDNEPGSFQIGDGTGIGSEA